MYFRAQEVAELAGISKNTLLRWLKQGKVAEPFRDRNGWRVFQQEDVDRICAFANKTSPPVPYTRAATFPGTPDAGGPRTDAEAA